MGRFQGLRHWHLGASSGMGLSRRMRTPLKILIVLAVLAGGVWLFGSIPWTSRTVVDIAAIDEAGAPLAGVKISLISGPGGILAEGVTNEKGKLVLKYSPNPNTDWGKHVWRFDIFLEGYVANETPVRMSEERVGNIKAWLPDAPPEAEKPHLRFLIQARIVCRKIS
jgi:hypothetical protein